MTLRYDPAAVTRQFDTPAGLTLTDLAVLRRIPRERAAMLIEPFVRAGLVEVRDGVLVLVDRDVASAFAQIEELPA